MQGIRARYGNRHTAIITELGLTKEYRDNFTFKRDPRDTNLGDLGWLNHTQTLDEDFFFDSLHWYNDFINQDDYVLGACLFEVGHSGRFRTHRHLGVDNHGRELAIMQRIQGLSASTPTQIPHGTSAASARVHGMIRQADGTPLHNVTIRLVGDIETLGACRQAVLSLATTDIVWDRTVRGIEGDRWRCYQKYVAQDVAGLPYAIFKDQVVAENPTLAATNNEFVTTQSYTLPRNTITGADVGWDRTISGFSGNRWLCWQKFVAGRVLGLTWTEFAEQVMAQNPHLDANDGNFYAHHTYQVPQNPAYRKLELLEFSDEDGFFAYADLVAGDYRIIVTAPGYEPLERIVAISDDEDLALKLQLRTNTVRPTFQAINKVPIHAEGGRFFQGNQPLPRFVGVNLPHLLYLNDHHSIDQTHGGDLSLDTYLDKTLALGARGVRLFVPHRGSNSSGFSNQEMADRLVHVLEALSARDMYLIPALIDQYHNVSAYPRVMEPYYVDFKNGDPSVKLGPRFFTEGYKSTEYQDYVRTIIQSVPAHLSHTIFCWEIGNELKMEHPGDNPPHTIVGDPVQFVNFNRDMATMIKKFNPHRHMVTTGMISTQHVHLKGKAGLIQQLYAASAIDFLTVHVYYGPQNRPPAQMIPNNEPDFDAALARTFHKPIIVEEAGIHRDNDNFRGRLKADLQRYFKDTHTATGQERQPAAGYMIFRPPFGLIASGKLHADRDILQECLSGVPSMTPIILAGDGHVADAIENQPAVVEHQAARVNKIGIDLNRPINGRQRSEVVSKPHLIAETGVGWVRLNFALQDAASPDDPQWQATYDSIINDFKNAGLRIYGLIGGEAVQLPVERRLLDSVARKTNNGSRGEAEEWLDLYEHNFLQIVKRYGDRITHFESYNEPDNFSIPSVSAAVVHPTWFAHILHRVFHRVKPAFPHIKLISGPLLGHFHHQPSGQAAPTYLRQVYAEGQREFGWHSTGRFPFDGLGYHLYVKPNQQTDFAHGAEHAALMDWETHAQRVRDYYRAFTNAILAVVQENEGAHSPKRLFLSEMGWTNGADNDALLTFHAQSVALGLGLMADDPRVELGFWFCTRDFPDHHFGLFRSGMPLENAKKPAFDTFRAFCTERFGHPQPAQLATKSAAADRSLCALPPMPEPVIRPGLHFGQARAVLMLRKKWVQGTVLRYYFFDQGTDGSYINRPNGSREWVSWVGTEAQKAIVRQAFQTWKAVGISLEFKEVSARGEAEIRIGFQEDDGHWSYIGRDIIDEVGSAHERTMNFDWRPGSINHLDTALHEIGHTLGLAHEHQNPKAGIVWNEEAVYAYFASAPNHWPRDVTEFNIISKINPDDVQGSNWDPNSIMHYAFDAGLIKEPATYAAGLTPVPGLSERDKQWALTFYPPQAKAPATLRPFVAHQLTLHTGEQEDFAITPDATRTYTFSTFGEADVVMVLFEEVNGELRYRTGADDSACEDNAQFQVRLFAGKRYTLRIRVYYNMGGGQTAVMYW